MTEDAATQNPLSSNRPALALPEVPAFSPDSQSNRPQRRVYYFDIEKHLYPDSKAMRVLGTMRLAWFSHRPIPVALMEVRGVQAFPGVSLLEIPLALHGYPAYLIIDELIPSEGTLKDLFSAITKDVGVIMNQRMKPFMDPLLSTVWVRLNDGISIDQAVKGLDFTIPAAAPRKDLGLY
ncbi:hypothetical protein [Pollutimonas sp. M17]|uniref:hypothetical protein n=1 Tax=Pollutimonas sp. M17 TaxID=2962065 RepID=UPI0021F3FE53|nr:hypothetical protein [Pollutimonas sp. M17]UYO93759.1 hypothetical protein OEG81_00065 [Pollutimonas sp. M17]